MLHGLRIVFILGCGILGSLIGYEVYRVGWFEAGLFGAGVGFTASLLEFVYARRFIGVLSVVMFGVLFGFVVSYLLIGAINLIPALRPDPLAASTPATMVYRDVGITFVFCFLSVLAILHAKDDFKFVIPFIELKREGQAVKPLLLDTSAIIDGRIADILNAKILDAPVIVPQFVLDELQTLADSADKMKRERGRRGLDILQAMRKANPVQIEVRDVLLPEVQGVDAKLVKLATLITGRLVTTDFNLNKVASVQNIEVINVNDLANALRPPVIQGEKLTVKIVKRGESASQGVGYLEDGTMVVCEECADRIGQEVELVVTNILQTRAGRMVFAKPAAPPVGSAR
jgi:uncharacterized protein YacL